MQLRPPSPLIRVLWSLVPKGSELGDLTGSLGDLQGDRVLVVVARVVHLSLIHI